MSLGIDRQEVYNNLLLPVDSITNNDTTHIDLPYSFNDFNGIPGNEIQNPLFLKNPSNITSEVKYDSVSGKYVFYYKVGKLNYRHPVSMSYKDYMNFDLKKSNKDFWKEQIQSSGKGNANGIIPPIYIGGKVFDRIFGGNTIDIRPTGSAELSFGLISNKREDPTIDVRRRRTTNFDFDEKIQMNVMAKIGDKIQFQTNYNTEATFDFENKLKLKYEGKEDEIIQLIEAGDVSLPLSGTLITGSQSLRGVKTQLKFGRTTVTSVFSEQRSETKNITVQGGAQTNEFRLTSDEYEENRHFFLAQYFRDHYNEALASLPLVTSNINITKIEVWVTNIGPAVEDNRNIVAFTDLGEFNEKDINNSNIHTNIAATEYPSNYSNDLLYQVDINKLRDINSVSDYLEAPPINFVSGEDFEKVGLARKLSPTEFKFNSKLGFISLNSSLNSDQVLSVAYQYTVIGNDSVFQVGEFSDDGVISPNCLVTKMLKSTALNTKNTMWDLMMKNVYSIGAYQVNNEDFILNILYSGNDNGVPTGYITEGNIKGIPLIRVLGFDKLDSQRNPNYDGIFDFINNAATTGGTVQASNGRVYFTVVEPFGNDLRKAFNDDKLADKYCYDSLYTMTKNGAQQYPDKNKFIIEGRYKSQSGSEISLNSLNVPKGSVKVTAGGVPLTENVDYTVDYTLGRVKIINEGILNSGTPINISTESNTLFNMQTQRFMGTHIDYEFNKFSNLGATIINLHERPLTEKVNFGNEPISNTMIGFNYTYQTESRFLTKMIDKLPFIDTKAPSKITVDAEIARFLPGHAKAVGKTGTSYIDDFEGCESTIDLKNYGTWFLASTPQGQTSWDMFPQAAKGSGLKYGYNRAKLAWYVIDPLFYDRTGNLKPKNISKDDLSDQRVRYVRETEVFPNIDPPNGEPMNISMFDIAFFPEIRGPYNFDIDNLDANGNLKNPEKNWGGIMRKIETSDFEATNIEYIEFWMMDPFVEDPDNQGGELYFNLGDISEDILRDGRKCYENGLPVDASAVDVDTTIWGRIPNKQDLVSAFDNNPNSRKFQDVGYDGLNDDDERSFYDTSFVSKVLQKYGAASDAYQSVYNDPSGDNYHYFRGNDYDNNEKYKSIILRYMNFNGPDGNSPTSSQSDEAYPTLATTLPNTEDINNDNTLSEAERYYQYKIEIKPDKMNIGENFITDVQHRNGVVLPNGQKTSVTWYQFKVPIHKPDKVVGNIQDFRSIRFMRMFLKGFKKSIVCRFATLELVRSEWRKYKYDLLTSGEYIPEQDNTSFDISTVSIEENGGRTPVPYVLPPDIGREINYGTTNFTQRNEQSMVLKVEDLVDGDARAAYKTTDFDFRLYKKLKMYVHAEKLKQNENLNKGDLTLFIRLGADFKQNYYEYEIPLTFTQWYTSATDEESIWPDDNTLDIDLQKLVEVKKHRNIESRNNPSSSSNIPFVEYDGDNKITVLGTPSISDVRMIMIGIRNPKQTPENINDDGKRKSAEVWINELRLTDFDEKGGWAATARVGATLADLGNVVFSGNVSTPGFGSISSKVNDRQKEYIKQYDIATNLELGRFFPEKSGLKIPMHFDFSEAICTPEYDPLNPDVKYKEALDTYKTQAEKDSIKRNTQDYTLRKNINFVNVRKERINNNKRPHLYDIENIDLSYSYSEIYRRNIDIEYDIQKKYHGGIGYNFTYSPKAIKPFDKVKFFNKNKSFKIIKDINFFLLPKQFSFRTDMNRDNNERLLRNKSNADVIIEPTYSKNWDWSRIYNLKYDITEALKLNFSANANAYIEEPPGSVDDYDKIVNIFGDTVDYSLKDEILNFGSMNRYNQQLDITYVLPINKIPLFNWIDIQAKYSGNYRWETSPRSLKARLGNTIENSNTKRLNGSLKFLKLYNKIKYLKKINSGTGNQKNNSRPRPNKMMTNKSQGNNSQDTASVKPKVNYLKLVVDNTLRVLMGLRNVTITYDESNGTLLPGYKPEPQILGMDLDKKAPGYGFVFGLQPEGPEEFIDWLSTDTLLNNAYMTKFSQNFSLKASFEPIPDLRIDISADEQKSENFQEYFKADADGVFNHYSAANRGSFSISFGIWKTAFNDADGDNSIAFNKFKDYRIKIANRLASENPNYSGAVDTLGFPVGYGANQQEVLLPAFVAAYSGKSPDKVALNMFPKIPIPNWRLTYTGLNNLNFIRKYFKTFNISHAYRSSYNIGSYMNDINFESVGGYSSAYDMAENFIPENKIDVVSIKEQFSPLIKIDMGLHNNMLVNFEIKKSRDLSLSFVNNQLTEISSNELVFGFGYIFKNVQFTLNTGGNRKRMKSDLKINADAKIKKNKTILRRLDDDVTQISAGSQVISINTSADYNINKKFSIKFFFEKMLTDPFVSNQYKNSTTKGGFSLRFNLLQ